MRTINSESNHLKLGFRFTLVLFVFIFWTLSQLLIPIKFIPYLIISKIEILKMLIPATGIMLCSLLYVNRLKFTGIGVPFFLFGAFVFVKACIGPLITPTDLDYFANPIMYMCWVVVMFVTAPSIFNSLSKIRAFLKCMVATFSIVAVVSILFVIYFSIDISVLYKEERFTFIYANPLYLGAVSYSIVCCCLMLRELSNSVVERKLLLLLIVLCCGAIIASFSRTFMVAVLVLFFVHGFNKQDKKKSVFVFFILCFMVLCLLIFLALLLDGQLISANTLNDFSSNRLTGWVSAFQKDINSFDIIWGGSGSSNSEKMWVSSDGQALDATFRRYAIDNTYIELFVNTGLIGISLFLWGLGNIYRTTSFARLRLRSTEDGKGLMGILSVSYAVLASIIVSALFYGHYPSLGNTINSAALPAALSVIVFVNRQTIAVKEAMSK